MTASTRYLTTGQNGISDNIGFELTLGEAINNEALILPFMVIVILLSGFFILPLMLLVSVHSKNFYFGKTTIERFGRVGADNDRETRIMNSGI